MGEALGGGSPSFPPSRRDGITLISPLFRESSWGRFCGRSPKTKLWAWMGGPSESCFLWGPLAFLVWGRSSKLWRSAVGGPPPFPTFSASNCPRKGPRCWPKTAHCPSCCGLPSGGRKDIVVSWRALGESPASPAFLLDQRSKGTEDFWWMVRLATPSAPIAISLRIMVLRLAFCMLGAHLGRGLRPPYPVLKYVDDMAPIAVGRSMGPDLRETFLQVRGALRQGKNRSLPSLVSECRPEPQKIFTKRASIKPPYLDEVELDKVVGENESLFELMFSTVVDVRRLALAELLLIG